ncbi:DUF885 domain-containing protein [uncultured Sphingomonas sp.]|uniref:DUF885 domain-containing protein n=1 Tax=uncultured Sphingomonas sp. TaxID=158754 RepID=UPI0035C9C1CE
MRIRLLSASAILALSGCNETSATDVNVAAVASPTPAESWPAFRDAFIEGWFKVNPADAVYQGRHDFDGQMPDWSPAGLKAQGDFLRRSIAGAKAYDGAKLNPGDAFERDYLVKVAEGKLFWLEDADQPHTNPAYYVGGGLDPNVYIARPYADAPTRMKAITRFLMQVPAAADNIRTNLRTPLPLSFINYGVAGFGGLADYYVGDAKKAFAGVRDPELHKQFDAAAKAAALSMKSLANWLDSQKGTATQGFALGADRFRRMLATTEAVDVPLDQLEAAGRADLARNQAALKAACATFAAGRTIQQCVEKMNANKPPDNDPVAEARKQIPMLRRFVVDNDLVSIPGTEQALVEESPPYNRQNSAYIDPPGPFDKGIASVYYISPPDPSWSKEKQLGFVPGKMDLLFTSVHEVMPGHFVQFLHANRSPSLFGRLFVGYGYAEGWAHYAEEMMWEAGLGRGDAETHIGELSNALLRDCRFLSAIGMHAKGMSQAESFTMFREQCYQGEGSADQQAARGTYDPAYLNYTMGKLMIRRLREDWTATRGGRAAWKAFHDRFLSYGGPPIPLVRAAMMGGDAKAVF